VFLLLPALAFGEPASPPGQPEKPAAQLGVRDAVVLGLVEGITEFLPISSTGHLIIANDFLGLNDTTPLVDGEGRPLWHRPPSPENPEGEPLTLKLAADAYAVIIQAGAIMAVMLLYWRQMRAMAAGLLVRDPAGFRLFRNVLLAFLPVAAAGYVLHGWIDRHLFSVPAVIAALVAGALLMLAVERWRRTSAAAKVQVESPADLSWRVALTIGLGQCAALWPGTSRSMVTIVGGYFAGLAPARAAEFSFLVGLPTLAGAAVYKAWKAGPSMIAVLGWADVLLGAAVAAVSAALAVRFLVGFLSRHGLHAFALYRLALAALLAVWHWF
jgi:undecaprenyl-diphosphatase